jgi:hypothetical protein
MGEFCFVRKKSTSELERDIFGQSFQYAADDLYMVALVSIRIGEVGISGVRL